MHRYHERGFVPEHWHEGVTHVDGAVTVLLVVGNVSPTDLRSEVGGFFTEEVV